MKAGASLSDRVIPALQPLAPGEAEAGLEIRLFGPMEVRIGPHPLPRLRSRKGLWLLALLALRAGRDVERRWLAETLWPESDAAAARHSLRQSLSDLRLALGPEAGRLASEGPRTLRLDVAGAFVDVLAFDAALARGEREALEGAVGLYRGPLLEDCAEEWVLEERRPREHAYVAALGRLAAAARARGEHAAAASHLQLAVGADPYREDFHRALMEALVAAGNPVEALRVYRHYRDLLWREMAAEPAEETTALFRRLRDETRTRLRRLPGTGPHDAPPAPPASAPGPTGNLPRPLSTFVGRESELQKIAECLASTRLVTLTGTGGIGKTRLAIRVAEESAWEYPDGAYFVDLAALAGSPPERSDRAPAPAAPAPGEALVPQTVARVLKVREAPSASLTETLQEALAARRLLLVLDNCEHLIDACARLADALLSGCPHLRILATSRQPLGLTGEQSYRVPPLSLPDAGVQVFGRSGVQGGTSTSPPRHLTTPPPEHLNTRTPEHPLLASEAILLFVERAQAAMPGFALSDKNAPTVFQVCRRLDGIPLAIELAAARLKVLPIEQIAARLDDRFHLLTGGSRTALPRQQTLRATLDWGYDLLSEPERILLRRLSVFTGGFTLEAAEQVCSADGYGVQGSGVRVSDAASAVLTPAPCPLYPDEILDLLASLVDWSLVGVERREGAARYVLLETTRDYARDRLREAGEDEERRARHAGYFLALAERAEPELRGAAQAEWLQRLEEEHDNLRAAIDHFLARGAVEEGLRLGGALGWFWWIRGYLSEGRERLQALLHLAPPGAGFRRAQAKALNAAGMLADDQDDHDAARALFEASLAVSRAAGDRPNTALALGYLGGQALQARDFPAARALYEESLTIWREMGDRWWTASALTGLGRVAFHEGQYAAARTLVESALEIQRQLQDRRAIARSLTLLGNAAVRLGDREGAYARYNESLALARELGARGVIEETLGVLGKLARDRGDHAAAIAFHQERLTIVREVGSASGIAESLYDLGVLARDRGEGTQAAMLWSESLVLFQRLGDERQVAECLERLASLAVPPHPTEPERSEQGEAGSPAIVAGLDGARWAARLLGAAAALRDRAGAVAVPWQQAESEQPIAAARAMLGDTPFAAAWAQGQEMALQEAVAEALRGADPITAKPDR